MAEKGDVSLTQKEFLLPCGTEPWTEGDSEGGERWIFSVLSQIPRSVYHGGGDLAPRDPRVGVKAQDKKNGALNKNSKPQDRKKKRSSGSNRSSKNNDDSGDEVDDDPDDGSAGLKNSKREELRERLRQKLAQHQRERKADGEKGDGKKEQRNPKQSRELRKNRSKKIEKKGQRGDMEADTTSKVDNESKTGGGGAKRKGMAKEKHSDGGNSKKRPIPSDSPTEKEDVNAKSAADTFEINRIAVPGEYEKSDSRARRMKKRRKLSDSKLKELQRQLAAASKEQELKGMAEDKRKANGDSDLGCVRDAVKQREIDKALQRAKGERPKDNVAKIRKSIRKEKRKKEKSKEEWAKRVEVAEKEKEERQERREKNLKERREARKSPSKRSKKSGGKGRGKGKTHGGAKRGK